MTPNSTKHSIRPLQCLASTHSKFHSFWHFLLNRAPSEHQKNRGCPSKMGTVGNYDFLLSNLIIQRFLAEFPSLMLFYSLMSWFGLFTVVWHSSCLLINFLIAYNLELVHCTLGKIMLPLAANDSFTVMSKDNSWTFSTLNECWPSGLPLVGKK